MNDDMVYVAEDRGQPGAAFAICIDDIEYAKETAKTLADWVKRGAIVHRCDREVGLVMLDKWVRPAKKSAPDLFGNQA
mgnify:CR=1 FL=1